MKRIGYTSLAALAVLACAFVFTTVAQAQTPNPNGAVIITHFFNDCPVSTVTSSGGYPGSITIDDTDPFGCAGGLNKQLWKFSEDGGVTKATFHNASNYTFCADLTLTGNSTSDLEAGLEISPWWSDGDGQFMVNGNTGEIAIFGGRLPFFSFTGTFGLHYVAGTTVHVAMTYIAGAIDPTISGLPAHVTYDLVLGGTPYTSGPLAFDQGNTSENPPHGLWGSGEPTSAGGYLQKGQTSGVPTFGHVVFGNICYSDLQGTPTHSSTWGSLKALYR